MCDSLFQYLKTTDGQNIRVDSFQYVKIAAVAFGSVYWRLFLPENKIIIICYLNDNATKRPGKDEHSNQAITWMQ